MVLEKSFLLFRRQGIDAHVNFDFNVTVNMDVDFEVDVNVDVVVADDPSPSQALSHLTPFFPLTRHHPMGDRLDSCSKRDDGLAEYRQSRYLFFVIPMAGSSSRMHLPASAEQGI